jgi:hypothetical protein
VDAKHNRQQFGRDCRNSVIAAHHRGMAQGISEPVVMVLDLRDRLASDLARTLQTNVQFSISRSNAPPDLISVVEPMSQANATALIAARSAPAAKLVKTGIKPAHIRVVIVAFGGMTCTNLRSASAAQGDKDGRSKSKRQI